MQRANSSTICSTQKRESALQRYPIHNTLDNVIRPESKRIFNFETMKGKTVEEIGMKGFCLRIVFTDGSFVDLDVDTDDRGEIVIDKGKHRRQKPYH